MCASGCMSGIRLGATKNEPPRRNRPLHLFTVIFSSLLAHRQEQSVVELDVHALGVFFDHVLTIKQNQLAGALSMFGVKHIPHTTDLISI